MFIIFIVITTIVTTERIRTGDSENSVISNDTIKKEKVFIHDGELYKVVKLDVDTNEIAKVGIKK